MNDGFLLQNLHGFWNLSLLAHMIHLNAVAFDHNLSWWVDFKFRDEVMSHIPNILYVILNSNATVFFGNCITFTWVSQRDSIFKFPALDPLVWELKNLTPQVYVDAAAANLHKIA